MDQNTLVSGGHALIQALDNANMHAKAAMWVRNSETGSWKLWIVPPANIKDKHEFYRRLAEVVSKFRPTLGGIDVSDTEMISENHPAMKGLRKFISLPGLGSVSFSGNRFNGYYLPDGIILRVEL